ncbi:aromatic-ring-hydroxylating dioxygenase subunit beta [Celeribacter indicus]|uniref:Biphenyl 2,3-dioxygenase subunit beta n=1 Tax=Celeribacter indicus TaxID=1208324 RepID=A0A0B5DXV7_9RHOB|nr:aromatic-ring-hydroxylating dioxygenase subunit beta [Celeribacter indicus]AJE45062.1 Biphenyl 2,3-dioxygenase subunit beta [Celeribacter indicus]SDX42389.1 biphenyl 2,3-dioxygenase beta subunit [Celeribacter indicus]
MLDDKMTDRFAVKPGLVPVELQHEVEQFYFWEAKLMTDRRYVEWFALLAKDLRYWMPLRETKFIREAEKEYADDHGFAHFDDTWATMDGRIRKITSDVGWSENPASRVRHIIGNVMISPEDDNTLHTISALVTYRSRQERQVDIFACERQDVLRRTDSEAGFEIVRRKILIDQSTILSNNLSFFF